MIVPMKKAYIVARDRDRDALVTLLGREEVVHLTPARPDKARADEATVSEIDRLETALSALRHITPSEESVEPIDAVEAAREVNALHREDVELANRLAALQQQVHQLALWGDTRLEDIECLRQNGLDLRFYMVPPAYRDAIEAPCVETITTLPNKKQLVGVVWQSPDQADSQAPPIELPDQAEALTLPSKDRPTLIAEAAEVDAQRQALQNRLAQLAQLTPAMTDRLAELNNQAEYTIAIKGGLCDESLFALQGWIPAEKAEHLGQSITEQGLHVALQLQDPTPDDQPPSLVRPPKWAQPIDGLFNLLGTVAGYKEYDVSVPFMIALPIFAAILIGDGGYGAILFLGPLLFFKKVAPKLGEQFTKLLIVIGAASLIWGFLCGSFFGVVLYDPPIPVNMTDASRRLIMRISFFMGAVHLSIAQLWQAIRIFPDLRFLNRVGWAVFVWGMLGVVKMFVLQDPMGWSTPWPFALIVGAALAILFAKPSPNVVKMLLMGIADFPLSMLSAFSDVISYVRLMAVGLASGVLAASFNQLAMDAGVLPITILTLVFGHGLNVGLALIALFAHGVRLNMLEFSNNLGMEWTGYAYQPFNVTLKKVS